ncbi:MAG: EAL domain-containing protein [Oscillospiraceae bacterium]|nr:EAL domain-containing protein [Oscillospiraceae bacterium]
MIRKNSSPINRSITIGCLVFIVIISLILAIHTYFGISRALYGQYDARLEDVVISLEHETDTDDLRECIRNASSSPKRDELQQRINRMVDDYELEFLYIVIPIDSEEGGLLSVISSTSEAERLAGDVEDWPILYDCSDDYTREELQLYLDAMKNPGVSFFKESSDWGECYTACKPLVTSDGEVIALTCADYSIEALRGEVLRHVLRSVAITVAVCVAFGLLLAWWLKVKVTKPIKLIEQSALRFAKMSSGSGEADGTAFDVDGIETTNEVRQLIEAMSKLSQKMLDQAEDATAAEERAKRAEDENVRLTEKANAALKIAELTQSVSSLLTNMPGVTFSKDVKNGRYLACNQAFAEYAHKADPEGVVGLTDYEIFDEKTARHFVEDDAKAMEMDKPYIFYEDVLDAAGNPRQFRTTKLKFTDATGRLCLLGMCLDYTELMLVKEETAEAKEAYEKARSASDIYAHIARALSSSFSRLYYVNINTEEFIEFRSDGEGGEMAVERNGEDFFTASERDAHEQLYPEDLDFFLKAFTKDNILRTIEEDGSFNLTYRLMVNGEPSYVSMKATRMQDDESSLIIGVNAVNADVRNELTGLYTETSFAVHCRDILSKRPEGWCVIAFDLEHFKLFNEWYGRDAGDKLLSQIGARLAVIEEQSGGAACYLGQDDFALLVPYDEERIRALYSDVHGFIMEHGTSVGFMPAIGVCMADGSNTIEDLYDRAAIASHHAKESFHTRIRMYDPSMYQQTENDYQILSDFQNALRDRELFFMLQPQCEISSSKIVGAESLVRWKKSDGQMVSPGVFVPVLERYGFVTDLDKYVWEEVCAWQRRWIDSGHTALPVSVNVSQIDIFSIDVPEYFDSLISKYSLPSDVIKIEITESAYVGDGSVVDTVKRLREKGFLVLMDDFGSGYSSLNMLRNLNVDIIKLDAQFLRMNNSDRKGIHILESIVNMAKTMGVPIIVEGVETKDESDFISSLGCRYVQGYLFYRPMPVEKFEELIADPSNVDTGGFVFKLKEEFHTREFLDQNIFSDVMLNNILGPVAIFLLNDDNIDCIRFNQQFYNEVGSDSFDLLRSSAQRLVVDEDLPVLYGLLEHAINDPLNGAAEVIRFKRLDGSVSQFRLHFFYLDEDEKGKRFYGSAHDITQLDRLNGQLRMMSKLTNDEVIFLRKRESGFLYQVTVHGLEEALGVTREEFERELNTGEVRSRADEQEVERLVQNILAANMRMTDFSEPFNMKGAGGRNVKIQLRLDSVQDKSSGVEYLLILRKAKK